MYPIFKKMGKIDLEFIINLENDSHSIQKKLFRHIYLFVHIYFCAQTSGRNIYYISTKYSKNDILFVALWEFILHENLCVAWSPKNKSIYAEVVTVNVCVKLSLDNTSNHKLKSMCVWNGLTYKNFLHLFIVQKYHYTLQCCFDLINF